MWVNRRRPVRRFDDQLNTEITNRVRCVLNLFRDAVDFIIDDFMILFALFFPGAGGGREIDRVILGRARRGRRAGTAGVRFGDSFGRCDDPFHAVLVDRCHEVLLFCRLRRVDIGRNRDEDAPLS